MQWMLAFSLGILSLAVTPRLFVLTDIAYIAVVLFAIQSLFYFYYLPLRPAGDHFVRALLQCQLALLLGIAYGHSLATSVMKASLPSYFDGHDFEVTGYISGNIANKKKSSSYLPMRSEAAARLTYQQFEFTITSIKPLASCDEHSTDSLLCKDAHRHLKSYPPKKIKLSSYTALNWQVSQLGDFTVRLKEINSFYNKGGFDYRRFSLANRINATGYIRTVKNQDLKFMRQTGLGSMYPKLIRFRQQHIEKFDRDFGSLTQSGLLQAILFGDRSKLSETSQSIFQRTGTIHLIAISGLHISIAAGIGVLVAKILVEIFPSLLLRFPARQLQLLLALPMALFYASMAGMPISAQRALLMLTCFFLMQLLKQNTTPWTSLVLAMFIVLLIDPLAILAAGFWFSFYAVGILCYLIQRAPASIVADKNLIAPVKSIKVTDKYKTVEVTASNEPNENRQFVGAYLLDNTVVALLRLRFVSLCDAGFSAVPQYLRGLLKIQLAFLVAMPIVLSLFDSTQSLIAPIANFLVVPVFSLIVVPLSIITFLLSLISIDWAAELFFLINQLLNALIDVLQWFDEFQLAYRWPVLSANLNVLFLFILVLTLPVVLLGWRAPGFLPASLIVILLLNPLAWERTTLYTDLKDGEYFVSQLDVGQGTAVLVGTRNYRLLYDTGFGYSERFNAADAVIKPYLRAEGLAKIDTVMLSHGDNDHAGGAQSILNSLLTQQWRLGGENTADLITSSKFHNQADTALWLPRYGLFSFVSSFDSLGVFLRARPKFTSNKTIVPCYAGQRWQRDGVQFEILSPNTQIGSKTKVSENDRSCVLRISSVAKAASLMPQPSGVVLLTGDISRQMEFKLLERSQALLASDIMSVPHHGSASSSSSIFLDHAAPRYALLSVAKNNRYGHPKAAVVKRYKDRGIMLLRSDQLGTVQFVYRDQVWHGPYCARKLRKHFWDPVANTAVCKGPLQ